MKHLFSVCMMMGVCCHGFSLAAQDGDNSQRDVVEAEDVDRSLPAIPVEVASSDVEGRVDDLNARLMTLQAQLERLTKQLQAERDQYRTDKKDLEEKIRTLAEGVLANTKSIESNAASVAENQKELEKLAGVDGDLQGDLATVRTDIEQLRQSYETHGNMLAGISTDDPDGRRVLDVLGNMSASPQFRDEFQQAIQGKLRIKNYTGQERVLYINGNPWRVRVNESYVFVPIGTVSIHSPGEDRAIFRNDWSFNPDTNQSELVFELMTEDELPPE